MPEASHPRRDRPSTGFFADVFKTGHLSKQLVRWLRQLGYDRALDRLTGSDCRKRTTGPADIRAIMLYVGEIQSNASAAKAVPTSPSTLLPITAGTVLRVNGNQPRNTGADTNAQRDGEIVHKPSPLRHRLGAIG